MAVDPKGAVRIDGLREEIALHTRRTKQLKDYRVPLRRAQIALFAAIQRNFQKQGSDEGPWEKLKPLTLARKLKTGHSPLILIYSGALKRDWDLPEPEGNTAQVQSKRFYGTYHQTGAGHLPKRRVTPSDAATRALVLKEFKAYTASVLREK